MTKYILKKILYGWVVLIAVIVIISSIIYLAPVDPARLTFGQRADTSSIEAKKESLGLNKPLYVQLALYLNDLSPISLHDKEKLSEYSTLVALPLGDSRLVVKAPFLRHSFQTGEAVSSILWTKVPRTVLLAVSAMTIACVIGILLGVLSSMYPNSIFDSSTMTVSILGISLPSYVTAMLLAYVFGYLLMDYTGLSHYGGIVELDDFTGEERIAWRNLILPALALGVRPVAIIAQLTRSSMLDVLGQDYIRTAKAKGLSTKTVLFKHALRNALNPVLTAVSGWFASLLAGAFFVEHIFGFGGLGEATITAILNFDIPVVLGTVLFAAIVFVLINIVVDILYTILNPQVVLK